VTGVSTFVSPRHWLAVDVAFTFGCATSNARIYRSDGPPLSAEILDSDASHLMLRVPQTARWEERPRQVALGQYQVSSIDHPGNVLALIGLGSAAAGAAGTMALIDLERQPGHMDNGFGGLVGFITVGAFVIGLTMFAFNSYVWGSSKTRARAFERSRPPDWMIPPPAPGQSETVPPPQPPLGDDDEDPSKKPARGFRR